MIRMFSISGIAAINQQNILGINGHMPWGQIKRDLKFYKEMTIGKSLICGGNTFRSLPSAAIRDRQIFVISSQQPPDDLPNNIIFINDIVCPTFLMDHIEPLAISKELMVIGGGMIYKAFEDQYDKFYLTEITGPEFETTQGNVVYFDTDLSKRSTELEWSSKVLDCFVESNKVGSFNVKITELS